jgi:glycerophosphoryl diester phosphodiesterase
MTNSASTLNPLVPGRWDEGFLRIGHSGAGAYAPPNTLKSLAMALEMGVDMVEFDVRPCVDALILLHDDKLSHFPGGRGRASQRTLEELRVIDVGEGERIPSLIEALDLIDGRVLMNVDLKTGGIEADVIDLLNTKGLMADALISSLDASSLRRVRQLAPQVNTGFSYPKDLAGASERPYLGPIVSLVLKLMGLILPYRVLGKISRADANATMLYHKVLSPATVERVHQAGGRVFAWTVDELPRLRQVQAMGVDGIASNRPDLFDQL